MNQKNKINLKKILEKIRIKKRKNWKILKLKMTNHNKK